MNIDVIKTYFDGRVTELEEISAHINPWVFLCASAFMEYLVKLINDRETDASDYKKFILNWMNPKYKEFKYRNGEKDLDVQMYHVLRCGIVHSFSFIPDEIARSKGARNRSIVLTNLQNKDGNHLDNYAGKDGNLDAAIFVAEDYVNDIKCVCNKIFDRAKIDPKLSSKIMSWYSKHPPIVGGF